MKFGLIGETLGHSLSPAIHGRLLAALGLSASYELVEIPRGALSRRVPELLETLDGFNVTIPYKTDILPFLGGLSDEAAAIGAVNTVAVKNGRAAGYNTDYAGFSRTLDAVGADPAGRAAVVLGTGGASRAVIQCLFDRGAARIFAASRHPEAAGAGFRAFAAARRTALISYGALEAGAGVDLLVNCTPCGMVPRADASPVSEKTAGNFPAVIDLIYNPAETKLLRAAKKTGARTANGLRMLVAQAAAAEEIWLGRPVPDVLLRAVLRDMEGCP